MKQFKPICLLNVDYKGFTKVLNNKLNRVVKEVIGESQTSFMEGRNILEGVVILHEVIHELRTKKKRGLIMKIDFEKTYDKVRSDFLEEVMRRKAFPKKWIYWLCKPFMGEGILDSESASTCILRYSVNLYLLALPSHQSFADF